MTINELITTDSIFTEIFKTELINHELLCTLYIIVPLHMKYLYYISIHLVGI